MDCRGKPGNDNRDPMTASRIHRLTLTHFRNYRAASLQTRGDVVVLVGPNGAGKTNVLEAISFLSPGRGLRRARLDEVGFVDRTLGDRRRHGDCDGARDSARDDAGDGARSWAVSAEVDGALGLATLGTGLEPPPAGA